jgi:WD40 repeat protein
MKFIVEKIFVTFLCQVGLHLRLVNCLVKLDDVFLVSGGEDGSLRIYETDSGAPASVLQAHLSSVKTLLRSKSLLLSAGGRAQLILWKLQFSNGNCK